MNMTLAIKELLMMSVKQKAKDVGRDEVYAHALYLPVVYFLVASPTIFSVAGVSLLMVVGIARFYPEYMVPIDFLLGLASMSTFTGAVMYLAYKGILKRLLLNGAPVQNTKVLKVENLAVSFAPVLEQFRVEQQMLKQAILGLQNPPGN